MVRKNWLNQVLGYIAAVLFTLFSTSALPDADLPSITLVEKEILIKPDQIEFLLDNSNLSFKEASSQPWRSRFQTLTDQYINFGITNDTVWLRFTLNNPTPLRDWIVLMANPRLDHVEFFISSPDSKVLHLLSGYSISSMLRPLPGSEIAFPLIIPSGKQVAVYARISSTTTLTTSLQVLTLPQYLHKSRVSDVISSSIIGAMLLLFIVTVMGLRKHPGERMWAFTAMVFVQLMYVLMLDGLSTEYLYPDHPQWTQQVKHFFIFLLAPAGLYYTMVVLNFRVYAPKLRLLSLALVALCILFALGASWMPGQFINQTASLSSGITAALLLGAIPYVWLRGNQKAWRFFLSILPLILSAFAIMAHNYALLHLNTAYVFLMFKLAYILFLSLQLYQALGRRRIERRQVTRTEHQINLWRKVTADAPVPATPQATIQTPNRSVLIHTLGRFEISRDGKSVNMASRGVPLHQLMLALILAGNAHGTSRTTMLDNLWPDAEGDQGEKCFRTTLYRLRQIIGADAVQQSGTLLSINNETTWVDSVEFEKLAVKLIHSMQDKPGAHKIEKALLTLRTYEGDFLPGLDASPVLARRERLRSLFQELVIRVAEHHLDNNLTQTALDIYLYGLAYSEACEQLFQGLLRCHLALGQHAQGLSAFERCRTILLENFNSQPSAETERLRLALAELANSSGNLATQ